MKSKLEVLHYMLYLVTYHWNNTTTYNLSLWTGLTTEHTKVLFKLDPYAGYSAKTLYPVVLSHLEDIENV